MPVVNRFTHWGKPAPIADHGVGDDDGTEASAAAAAAVGRPAPHALVRKYATAAVFVHFLVSTTLNKDRRATRPMQPVSTSKQTCSSVVTLVCVRTQCLCVCS